MSKFLYAVLTGLFGAVLLHIIIILGVPHFTGRDAYTRVTSEGVPFVFFTGIRYERLDPNAIWPRVELPTLPALPAPQGPVFGPGRRPY